MGEYSLMKKPTHVNPPEAAPDLTALVASRICHDLIGPVGAIVNGMELLDMAGGVAGPEQELIGESAASASARLRFFRIGFGAPGDQAIGRSEIDALLDQFGRDSRMEITWHPEGARPRGAVKLAFLALLVCESALAKGGQAEVTDEDGAWTVRAGGASVSVDPGLWGWLDGAGDAAALIPAKVQFALLPLAVAQAGRALAATQDTAGLTLRF